MKQADLHVGYDYAFPTYKPRDSKPMAARVQVISVDGQGRVTIRVVDAGTPPPKNAWNARAVTQNEQRQVATRDIACPWEEWPEHSASIGATLEARAVERRRWLDDMKSGRTDRLAINPERTLPNKYEEEDFDEDEDTEERSALMDAYVETRRPSRYITPDRLQPLLANLPVPVLRDILAVDIRGELGESGTVASTFKRAARLFETTLIASRGRSGHTFGAISRPHQLLGETDVAFVNAVRDNVSATGGDLLIPTVPPLPEWVDKQARAVAPALGWLRLAVGDTGGDHLHSPGCASSYSKSSLLSDHLPWWMVMLERPQHLCGRCGGPDLRDLVPLTGFVAAADVWQDRGRNRIERWQQAAFQRLLSATAAARAQIAEPDVTLTCRIVAALSTDAPGDDGWAAYAFANATQWNQAGRDFEKLTLEEQQTAHALVRDRLATLEAALPPSQRPLPQPEDVDLDGLRRRYAELKDLLRESVPQLERVLFTLPDAI